MDSVNKILRIFLFAIIILILTISFSLLGCKSEVEETAAETTAAETAAETTAAETAAETTAAAETTTEEKEPVTITWWSAWNMGEVNQEVFGEIADSYMAENPHVTVNIQWMGRDVLTKLNAAVLAGAELPDMVNHSLTELNGAIIKNDLAIPLDKYMGTPAYGEDKTFMDVFLPGVFDVWKPITNDQIYAIPHYQYTSLFWYDKSKTDALGITEVPGTWADLLATCEEIKAAGEAPLMLDGGIASYCAYYYYWLTNRMMPPKSLLMASLDKKGTSWDDPLFLEAAQKVQEIVDKGYFIDGYKGYQWPAGQVAWAQGNGVFLLMGSWITVEVEANLPDTFEVAGFPFPTVDGKGDINDVELHQTGFSILQRSKNPDACVDFIKYYITQTSQEKIAGAGAASSVRSGIASKYPFVDEMFENATTTHLPYDNLPGINPEYYVTVFQPLTRDLAHGAINAEEFISNIKEETINYWTGK